MAEEKTPEVKPETDANTRARLQELMVAQGTKTDLLHDPKTKKTDDALMKYWEAVADGKNPPYPKAVAKLETPTNDSGTSKKSA